MHVGQPPQHHHRRRARAHARLPRPPRDPPQPHRRLGHAVRHADRAPARHRRRNGRERALASARSTSSTRRARKKFDGDPSFAERARKRVVLLAGRRRDDARALARARRRLAPLLRRRSTRASASRSKTRTCAAKAPTMRCCPGSRAISKPPGVARLDQGALCVFLDEIRGPRRRAGAAHRAQDGRRLRLRRDRSRRAPLPCGRARRDDACST